MIKDKLKEIREKSGMNKKEFAKYLEMKYTTYNNYETGAREPDSEFLVMFSKKFNISTDFILGLQKEEKILHSYKLKSSEYSMVEKYRFVSAHSPDGANVVDTVLNREYFTVKQIKEKDEHIKALEKEASQDYLTVNAAHADDYINAPDELKAEEEAMFDD